MFTKEDYLNLAACISTAKVEGLQQASWLVVMHDKLLKAANPPDLTPDDTVPLTEG